MVCIKSAPRSALVAFAPDGPYLAAGTMAGSVDLSFSSTATLEIFKLDFQSDAHDLALAGACPSAERFNRLSWDKPPGSVSEEYSLGLLAGGLGDGSIGVWNPLKMISSEDENASFVAKLEKHVGPVRGLEFSSLSPSLLASGADEGELCVWDLAKPSEPNLFPSLRSVGSGAQSEISFVSWNPKFQHILSSTSYNGITVVWDLRQQKPVTSFADSSRRSCSVLQWNPDVSTQLIISSDDDSSPSLRVWDVRKTISPLREFVGHTKGVIAMSWCPYDSSYLITCAKDNRTICWDTTSGEIVCELPASTNWNFDIHWYPKIPGVISASSFDAKVGIYNIEACNKYAAAGEFGASVRLRAPKWLKCPTGASFGFGGKLLSFKLAESSSGVSSSTSEIYVNDLVTEHNLVSRSTEFVAAIRNGERSSLRSLCEKKLQDSISEDDRETWGFLKIMFQEEGTARTKLLSHLGFTIPHESINSTSDNLGMKLENPLNLGNGSFVEGEADNGEGFFNNTQVSEDSLANPDNTTPIPEEAHREHEEPTGTYDPSFDESVQRALVVGDYKGAISQCITANRMADALVIAHAGGPSLWESTRDQYLKNSLVSYLKVVSAVASNDLTALVNNRPLNSWKETLALLCTYAKGEEWTILCEILASRLMTIGNTLAATLCYICAGSIDKIVEIWSRHLKPDCEGRTFVDLLQDLIEKTIILTLVTGHKRFSASLSKLVENYAELLANQGLLSTAMEYLKLLGSEEPSNELARLRDRIAFCSAGMPSPLTYEVIVDAALLILPSSATSKLCFLHIKVKCQKVSYESSTASQARTVYGADHTSFGTVNSLQSYYQVTDETQLNCIPSTSHLNRFHQSSGSAYGGYQQVQPKSQFPHTNALLQPAQTFIPSQTSQVPQQNFASAVVVRPTLKALVPATPPALRNVENYQRTLGSQLYPGNAPVYQPGHQTSVQGIGVSQQAVGHRFVQPVTGTSAPPSFVPISTLNFAQRPILGHVQPLSPTKLAQVQSVSTPSAPPPTVQTVDTSNVPAQLKPIITTLTRLYNETSAALGGAHANPSKQIEDNSKKISSLFAKLNSGDLSLNAANKLVQLCQALDSGDFGGAMHIQVILRTSDWDECGFWLDALRRMIKTRQSVRL